MSLFGVKAPNVSHEAQLGEATLGRKNSKRQHHAEALSYRRGVSIFNGLVDAMFDQIPESHHSPDIFTMPSGIEVVVNDLCRPRKPYDDEHSYETVTTTTALKSNPSVPLMRSIHIAQWSPSG